MPAAVDATRSTRDSCLRLAIYQRAYGAVWPRRYLALSPRAGAPRGGASLDRDVDGRRLLARWPQPPRLGEFGAISSGAVRNVQRGGWRPVRYSFGILQPATSANQIAKSPGLPIRKMG